MKKLAIRLVILAVVAGGAWYGYNFFQSMPQRQAQIPTAKVRQGDVLVRAFARGELRAVRSATLTAPNLFGTVQVTKLAPVGAFAREKDLVVEFDDAEVLSRLEEKQLEIEQIDEQFKKSEADLAIRNNQDQVDLLKAKYAVRRAELEVKRNELLSAIDAKKNELNLEEARRRLKQLESDIKSRLEQAEAELAVLREKKQKALLEMARERGRLQQVKLLSPMSGLVAVKQNNSNRFGFGFQVPDIREGDQVQPGMPIADVLDLSELEVIARIGELDRANLSEGQEVSIALDAVPDKRFKGKIKAMSSMASANIFSSDPAKKFDVLFDIDMRALLSALGAKDDAITRILATAEANRKKAPTAAPGQSAFMMAMGQAGGMGGMMGGGAGGMGGGAGMGGGQMGGGMAGGAMGGMQGGDPSAAGGQGGQGGGQRTFGFRMPGAGGGQGGGGGMMGNMSEEDRKKFRDEMQKALKDRQMQDLTPEERTKMMTDIRAKLGLPAGAAGAGQGGRRPDGAKPEGGAAAGAPGATEAAAAGGGRGAGGQGGGRRGGMDMAALMAMSSGGRYSQKELDAAKLPPAPEEDTQLDVLLRPGLLSDVEIIVEKIPNAVHIPAQAIFEKDGKTVVYVKNGNKFEERVVKLGKRSESTMIILSGLKGNEQIALADPFEKKGAKKDGKDSKGPMNALPGGGSKS